MFLEGTFLLHGIEEVMDDNEIVILIDPWPGEEEKIKKVIMQNTGVQIFAISSQPTAFLTILIPESAHFSRVYSIGCRMESARGSRIVFGNKRRQRSACQKNWQ